MRPTYHPRLINGPFEDPGLFVPFQFQRRAFLFDLGDLSSLSPRDLLKVSHVFVTHTHMDHFIGFDRLLRLFLGRRKTLNLFGPKGFLGHMKGKLSGYSWDLVENYENPLVLKVTEIADTGSATAVFACQDRFVPKDHRTEPFSERILQEPALAVSTTLFDHSIPCLGFSMQERFHVNIKKDAVEAMGLQIGPWLKEFKEALFASKDPAALFSIPTGDGFRRVRLEELAERIAVIAPGQKIAYITDIECSPSNEAKAVLLAKGADHLFIEAPFLESEKRTAIQKHHLTAQQAGRIAGTARVKQFTLFHFSPRYTGRSRDFENEAQRAYENARRTE
ncbi:MAG: ribonuclease Z [Deltaproteobacteria bacterium]|nr:ribonuclease Z [Deltaproteobacteria bacterium]MBW1955777.1 ribonuclease Z [Deltaproteobacteria bacterium]MBW2043113.1 ribonuclease Z [Deltaproteobacteria bacterium]MBW2132896.1 ribonuclease Z [Deltaproteobacteria bacterium]